MSASTGSIDLVARRTGPRTVLERVRYDGISRCSRAFTHAQAALVVLSQLGPGVVRGDTVTCTGHLRADSHLIVTGQTGTRLMGGARRSHAHVRWTLDARAFLELIGEPLIAMPDADYLSATTIDLGTDAHILLSEIACVPVGAKVDLRTVITNGGRDISYDAIDASRAAPLCVGTFIAAGFGAIDVAALVAACDAVNDAETAVTIGVGELPSGVFARLLAADAWAIRSTLIALRAAARSAIGSGQGALPQVAHAGSDVRLY